MGLIGRILGWGLGGLIGLISLGAAGMAIAARVVGEPSDLGVRNGQFAACPSSPNCVSTQADPSDGLHYIEPMPFSGSAEEAAASIRAALAAERDTTIMRDEGGYIHAVARSPLMRYPDDVEFFVDAEAGVIHGRSAARLGYGDSGMNRARVERIFGRIAP